MFIDNERYPKELQRSEMFRQRSASATFRSSGAAKTFEKPADYKYFVPPGLLEDLRLRHLLRLVPCVVSARVS